MSWTNINKPTTSFDTTVKPTMTVEYLATEFLNFLMTENDEYLVTDDSRFWDINAKGTTNWTNITK